jgi:hypothetical protein
MGEEESFSAEALREMEERERIELERIEFRDKVRAALAKLEEVQREIKEAVNEPDDD